MAQSHKLGSVRGKNSKSGPPDSQPTLMSTLVCITIGIKFILSFLLFIANLGPHSFPEH